MTDYTSEDAKKDVKYLNECNDRDGPDIGNHGLYTVNRLVAWLAERELQDVAIDDALENSKAFKKIVNEL